MDFDDLGKPVATGRSGRILLGIIFLVPATSLAFAVIGGAYSGHSFLPVAIAIAIGLGYIGFRLVTIADGEHLFGRVASIVTAILMMAGGGALVALLIQSKDIRSSVYLGLGIVFGVAGGAWLLRSTIRRKDEP
jgi:hypothetical protein